MVANFQKCHVRACAREREATPDAINKPTPAKEYGINS